MKDFVQWQGHDFSMRGQTHPSAAAASGSGHLTCFTGTDTIPAIDYVEYFYGANAEKELIAGSVPATEHSVMCMGGKETEKDTYRRLLTEVYPKGIVSIVSDTWDYWHTLNVTIRELKDIVMKRDGKFVVRPDSGDPVKILCGDESEPKDSPAYKGTVEILYEIFGGEVNSKGYKQLDSHIGTIYGDSITLERAEEICKQLEAKGFASTNVVFGIGSYTYQYVTRDTFGFAMKATYGEVKGKGLEIFKDPLTDGGVKKSAKGLLRVNKDFTLSECVSKAEEQEGLLQTVFNNGKLLNQTTLADIRKKVNEQS
jgi:nicotinamide phosphoribosyltransferase